MFLAIPAWMMKNKYRVLILGHGEMGQAMEHLLRHRHALTIWQRHPPSGAAALNLETIADQQDFVLFCLPAVPHFDLAARLHHHLNRHCLCVTVAKGIDELGRLAAQALKMALKPDASLAVLAGPMISEEIRADRPAFAQVGAAHRDDYEKIRALFAGAPLYLEYSNDIAGISWSAVLKNIYAVAFGAADELQLGDNMRGFLAAAALDEITQIVSALGGVSETPRRLAGLGDLITTATSAGSHHHQLGRWLAQGRTETLQGEGIHALRMMRAHQVLDISHYPLLHLIERLLAKPDAAAQQLQDFLTTARA